MFNKTTIVQSPHTIQVRSEHVEQRAPTDESVRLLREMEEAAKKSVLACVRLENNVLRATFTVFREHLSRQNKVTVQLMLNGQERTIDITLERGRTGDDFRAVMTAVRDALVKDLATWLTEDLIRQHVFELQNLFDHK